MWNRGRSEQVPAAVEQNAEGSTVRLDGEVDIRAALEFKGVLIQALASRQELRMELGSLTTLDITTLQLLWAAERATAKCGTKLVLSGPIPEAMEEAMDLAGLERFAVDPQ
jgi:anti-anti-sigma factor